MFPKAHVFSLLDWMFVDEIQRLPNLLNGELHPEERGILFEGWIASLLRAARDYSSAFEEFYY